MAENIEASESQLNFIEQDGPQCEREPEPPVADGRAASARPSVKSALEVPLSDHHLYSVHPLESPPESVGKRYLRAGHQYFLKDEPHRLAFEDRGPRIATEHNRPDIAESMVEMAYAKGWRRIRVSGHDDFKREAWLAASLRGIAVAGYTPRPVDQARLNDLRQATMTNWVEPEQGTQRPHDRAGGTPATAAAGEPASGPISSQRADRSSLASPLAVPADEKQARAAVWSGELSEYGGAPYKHDPENSASYYAIYRDRRGVDHTVWGVDLERAIGESGARIGDVIQLESLGRRWVTIEAPVRDQAGTIIDVEEKEVYRNTWQIDVIGPDIARESTAAAPETAKTSVATSATATRTSDLNNAEPMVPASTKQRSAAERTVSRKSSGRSHGVQHGETRSSLLLVPSPDRALHLSTVAEAMREQGFSTQSIAKVQARATRMLESLQTLGAEVPAPRAYDVNSPAIRGRQRTPSDEATRTPIRARAMSEPAEPPLPRL
jgi:Large polyvalent protein-associated domain 7